MSIDLNDIGKRMDASVDAARRELAGLRTGRASPNLLDTITVDAYGSKMPLNQVGSVGAPEAQLLTVAVWDQGLVEAVEKAIRESSLGLNPAADGGTVRVPIPPLTEETRKDRVKVAGQMAEQGRISVRNIRRDGMEDIKKAEKDGDVSQDDAKRLSGEVQKLTDDAIKRIDEILSNKENEIMTV